MNQTAIQPTATPNLNILGTSRLMTREMLDRTPKPPPGKSGRTRWIEPEIGDVVTVRSVPGAYRLPTGLPEGAQLRLVRRDGSSRVVERDGWEFTVQILNLEGRPEWL